MRVKLKKESHGFPKGTEFEVTAKDDGFYTDYPFYQGWVKSEKGVKQLMGFEQEDCEVISW
jgi:hypothetical protein